MVTYEPGHFECFQLTLGAFLGLFEKTQDWQRRSSEYGARF